MSAQPRKDTRSPRELSRAEQDGQDLAAVLGTQEGRRTIRRIIENTGVLAFGPSGDMSHAEMAAWIGRRNVGVELMDRIYAVDSRIFPEMLKNVAYERELEKMKQQEKAKNRTNRV